MKVLELYSGIGGMHFALKESIPGERSDVVLAVEISPKCNEVYELNFPNTKLLNRNVGSLMPKEINALSPDLILMSPPCQPFTRLGKQKDTEDLRNSSLLQFIQLVPSLNTVSYILLENVKGFEVSKTRRLLLSVLRELNFTCEEFLLNPQQFGICNSRLRYYLLARRSSTKITDETENVITSEIPPFYTNYFKEKLSKNIPKNISEILEASPMSETWNEYSLPAEKSQKYHSVLDIVPYDGTNTCCFTRGYTHYLEGTGSVLSGLNSVEVENLKKEFKTEKGTVFDNSSMIEKLNLRYFTPKEIARLMTFPENFKFPETVTLKQRYKMISNSINIYVVSFLISYLVGKKDTC